MPKLDLLHLSDSLFPVGSFAHSDGLEAAVHATDHLHLREWIDVVLDENIGRLEGPAVWRAWTAFRARAWNALITLDEGMSALRPAASARRSTRAMGLRLLTTWQALHPDPRVAHSLQLAARGAIGPTLPIAFAGACACGDVEQRDAVEAFAYTRLASTASAGMRLMPIGQTDAHALLARTLARVPEIVDAIAARDADPESFTPAMDIAVMSQQYLHSRLFRS